MAAKNTLYQIDEKSSTLLHGLNKRQIAFIVLENHYESNKDLLHKIIGAVGLDLENDILIVQMQNDKGRIILNELYRKSPTKHFFIFGLSIAQLSLQSEILIHHPRVTEKFVVHYTHSLLELANDLDKKKQLWAYLKKIFK